VLEGVHDHEGVKTGILRHRERQIRPARARRAGGERRTGRAKRRPRREGVRGNSGKCVHPNSLGWRAKQLVAIGRLG